MARTDTTPPILKSLALPSVIDVTNGDAMVSFAGHASDQGGSGVERVDLELGCIDIQAEC